MIDDTNADFLVCYDFSEGFEIHAASAGRLESNHIGVNFIQHLQRILVALHILEHTLLRRISPAGVTPYFGFRTQAFYGSIEDLDAESRVDHVVDDISYRKQMDLRLLELDDRTAGV